MKIDSIPVKTDIGAVAVKERAGELSFQQRCLLIIIDGNKTVQDLVGRLKSLGDVGGLLEQMESDGFIKFVGGGSGSGNVGELHTDDRKDVYAKTRNADHVGIARAKEYLQEFVKSALGDDGEKLSKQINGFESPEEFVDVIETCREVVHFIGGKRKARLFTQEIQELLERRAD